MRIDPKWVSVERFNEYSAAASGDHDLASRLYEWNAEASAALFEIIHHFEVLLRNAIISQLQTDGQSPAMLPGTPWTQGAKSIEEVASRLRKRGKDVTAGRIYSGLTFGFWQSMFGNDYEELWRHSLQYVFRGSKADRSVIATYLESLNQLRNRIAHHGSLIELDVEVEAQKIFRLTSWINKDAEKWLRSIEKVRMIGEQRPIDAPRNVVVVSATNAWDLYHVRRQNAYVFQAGRSIKVVDHLAFYADKEIKQDVPRILNWFDAVDWNNANANRLAKSSDPEQQKLASVIRASKKLGWDAPVYQVFLLSGPKDEETQRLVGSIPHGRTGRGSAFVQGHRYLPLSALSSARDTEDLE
ncbi:MULTISPECIES: Abi family protein [unclassified Brevibacterium]|uniref:Abi family protein n=1 Tax=unclassified Brevibacterium TaxID=2614124 RepID=UPI001091F1FD|nr:Abi family protein [Brevibacterium sp. S22]TGD30887.1 hypothetical protein EB835_10940 [Brevibacterium sp. S22]